MKFFQERSKRYVGTICATQFARAVLFDYVFIGNSLNICYAQIHASLPFLFGVTMFLSIAQSMMV